ncbi:hypothetical protein CHS0354_039761 [Potamilus streckersoni]|uniref:Uncharacterized protein n=1 Tax=Potamilus streckersoni TaxID=2493646 RepID=A0AAE0VN14_9BIVA|nr:hypothetical protein CHS0354_039761 [Potamilus streckersoni]
MCCKGTTVLGTLVLVLQILCFLLDIVGSFYSTWYLVQRKEFISIDSEIRVSYYGNAWNECTESVLFKRCEDIHTDWLIAVRAFSVSCFLVFLAAIIVVIVQMCLKSKTKVVYIVAVCLTFTGAICAIIAIAVYAVEAKGDASNFSLGFHITAVVFGLGILAGMLETIELVKVNKVGISNKN